VPSVKSHFALNLVLTITLGLTFENFYFEQVTLSGVLLKFSKVRLLCIKEKSVFNQKSLIWQCTVTLGLTFENFYFEQVTLSGGQKWRVALARAAYSEARIVALDDPLSGTEIVCVRVCVCVGACVRV